MYKEHLAEFWHSDKALENSNVSFSIPTGSIYEEVGVNIFRNAIGANYLPHSSEYVAPPSIDIVRKWFETIVYGEIVSAKGTLKRVLLPPRWRLLMAHIIQCLGVKTGGFDQISNKDAIILYSLANGINIDYAIIFWEDIIIKLNKKQRENIVRYTRFLSLLMMHMMKEGYGDGEVTLYPTQVFSVNNWALKPNEPEGPPFIDHMLAICSTTKPVVLKAPKPSSNAERVSQGTKPGAQPGHKKHSTSSKQPSVSNQEATKGGSSKVPIGSKTSHLKRKKYSSLTMDSNPIQTSASTPVVTEMHKEDQQATGGPKSLGVTNEERADPHLNSGMLRLMLSAIPIAEVDLENLCSLRRRSLKNNQAGGSGKAEECIKVYETQVLKDLDSPEDKEDDKREEAHTTSNVETEDASVPNPSSPRSVQLQELTNQVLIHQSQKHKLELKKNKAESEAGLLKDQPSFPNVGQLNELLVKYLQTEFLKIFSTHDFSNSLPTEVKELPSKFNELTKEVKGLKLKEIPTKLEDFTKTAIASKKTEDASVPSAGQAGTQPSEGEKNTNQTTISQLFQRKTAKNANLTKQQSKPTPPPTTPIFPLVITTATTQMQSLFLQSPPKSSSQTEGEHIKKDKGKKAMSSEGAEKESTKTSSGSDDDEASQLTGSMAESSKKKKMKKFDYVTEGGADIHLTEEQISEQKRIEEDAKAEATK
ncbi:hypothetical protein Tco_1417230 [Tanacetum coccineum]